MWVYVDLFLYTFPETTKILDHYTWIISTCHHLASCEIQSLLGYLFLPSSASLYCWLHSLQFLQLYYYVLYTTGIIMSCKKYARYKIDMDPNFLSFATHGACTILRKSNWTIVHFSWGSSGNLKAVPVMGHEIPQWKILFLFWSMQQVIFHTKKDVIRSSHTDAFQDRRRRSHKRIQTKNTSVKRDRKMKYLHSKQLVIVIA